MTTTNTTRKPTIRSRYNELLALSEVQARPELVDFINGRLEALDKKNTSNGDKKPTAKQIANSAVQNEILECMSVGEQYTVSELMKLVPALEGCSNQYASSQVRALVNAGALTRTEDKRKAYFSLA